MKKVNGKKTKILEQSTRKQAGLNVEKAHSIVSLLVDIVGLLTAIAALSSMSKGKE